LKAWRYYCRFYRTQYITLVLTLVASIGHSGLYLLIPLLIRRGFDLTIPSGNVGDLAKLGLTILFIYFLSAIITLWVRHVILRVTKSVILRIREEILKKLYFLSRKYTTRTDRSKLHTIMVQDTSRLDMMSNALFAMFLPAILISSVLFAVLLYIDWLLFLMLLGMAPLVLLWHVLIGKKVKKLVREYHRSFESFSKGIAFVLRAIDLTRIQSAEDYELARQGGNFEDLRLSSHRMSWLRTTYGEIQNALIACAGILVLIVGGRYIATGRMTLGEFLSFFVCVGLLRTQLGKVFRYLPDIFAGGESLKTLHNWLETKDVVPYSGTRRIDFNGAIDIENVSFKYDDNWVIRDISLSIKQGDSVALVGPNGAGKSTITYLVLGFYRPHEGRLAADGIPYDMLDLSNLRRYIGVVRQDPVIFPGTILDNISYGWQDEDMEQVARAAELSTAREFIERLPDKYETFVGEDGLHLSGGQRQRIALARALMCKPRLLILDEPTSHLDISSIKLLTSNLDKLDPPPSILLISHDKAIVNATRKVFVIDNQSIASDGDAGAFLSRSPERPDGESDKNAPVHFEQ